MPTLITDGRPARVLRLHQENWGSCARRCDGAGGAFDGRGTASARRCATSPTIPHLLEDIGVTREQALEEADKPFWR